MFPDSTNLLAPLLGLGPRFPVYPSISAVVRVTSGSIGSNVYPAVVQQQNAPSLKFRDREVAYLWEPNSLSLAPATYRARLVGQYLGLPLYAVSIACCVPRSSFPSSAVPSVTSSSPSPPPSSLSPRLSSLAPSSPALSAPSSAAPSPSAVASSAAASPAPSSARASSAAPSAGVASSSSSSTAGVCCGLDSSVTGLRVAFSNGTGTCNCLNGVSVSVSGSGQPPVHWQGTATLCGIDCTVIVICNSANNSWSVFVKTTAGLQTVIQGTGNATCSPFTLSLPHLPVAGGLCGLGVAFVDITVTT